MNREELAWAAGFFDGEGTTHLNRRRWPRVGVVQTGEYAMHLLRRFQEAVGGLGKIYGPRQQRGNWAMAWYFKTNRFEEAQAIIAMLWAFLGPAKREQARQALLVYGAETTKKA